MVDTRGENKLSDVSESASRISLRERIVYIAAAFVVAGFVGWLYETCIGLVESGSFDWDHGGIGIPFLQIYGIGAILIELCFARERELGWHPAIVFLAICLLTAVLEYGAGALMLYGLGVQTWDYRVPGWDFLCTPDGLLCLRGVLSFAVLGIVLLYPVDTLMRRLRAKSARIFDIVVWAFVGGVVVSMIVAYAFGGTSAFK